MKNKIKNGFTLIELLVVVSIIALLMAIMMPALRRAREQARLVLCSSNQRQVVIGVNAYRSDNRDFPPSISERLRANAPIRALNNWTSPARLTYRPVHVVREAARSSDVGYIGYYMASYVPDAHVFNCPLSNWDKGTSYQDQINNRPSTYQELYLNGNNQNLRTSYFLFWNYFGYDHALNDKRFVGPGRDSRHSLIISDQILYDDGNAGYANTWENSHPFRGGYRNQDSFSYQLLDPTEDIRLMDTNINAGYVDGSVLRIQTSETMRMRAYWFANEAIQYIPKKLN